MSDLPDGPRDDLRRAVLTSLAYFAVVFAAGSALGTLRVFLLIPWLGQTAAVLIELPVLLAVAWVVCRRLVAAFGVPSRLSLRLVMGGVALTTLMCAELALSVLAFGRMVAEFFAQYREAHALLGLGGQVAFGLFPLMQLRIGHWRRSA